MKTEEETWRECRKLTTADTFQKGDLRSSKSDYKWMDDIPDSWLGQKVHPDNETDFIYYRPK